MANALTSQTIKEIVEVYKRPEPDCRTCSLFYDWEEGVCTQSNKDPCTNGDRYEPLTPVKLWRTAP